MNRTEQAAAEKLLEEIKQIRRSVEDTRALADEFLPHAGDHLHNADMDLDAAEDYVNCCLEGD